MSEPTYIACPRCGEPFPMTAMQKKLFIGRTLSCNRCAKPFAITEDTPDPVPATKMRGSSPVPQSLQYPPPPQPTQPTSPTDALAAALAAAAMTTTTTAPAQATAPAGPPV